MSGSVSGSASGFNKTGFFRKLTAEGNVVIVLGRLDSLDIATDVELLNRVLKVSDGRVGIVIVTEDLDGLLDLVRSVDRGDCAVKAKSVSQLYDKVSCSSLPSLPVMMARAASSRGSRRAIRAPLAILRVSICC